MLRAFILIITVTANSLYWKFNGDVVGIDAQ
jgi:hypothetical protein